MNICITVFGEVPAGQALLRSGARAGDDIYASGTLGEARLALEAFRGTVSLPAPAFAAARARMEQPTPRVALGQALRGIATSAVDVSDGLLGDLGHVLRRSGVGACVDTAAAAQLMLAECAAAIDEERRLEYALAGGDDYELVFTAAPASRDAVQAAAREAGTRATRIGRIEAEGGLRLVDASGRPVLRAWGSFDHFA